MFNCCQLFQNFEKKNADKFMLGKKSEARKSLNKSKYRYIFYSPVFEEGSR